MSEPVYRVKPLVWEDAGKDAAFASTAVGFYDVDNWRYARNGEVIDSVDGGVAAAKASCEADYRSRLLRCLVEVVPNESKGVQHDAG